MKVSWPSRWLGERLGPVVQSRTVRTVLAVSGGNVVATLIALCGTLVQARFVGPDDLGYFRQFGIVTSYAYVFQLGISSALQRLYPLHRGRGEQEHAARVAAICQSWNVSVSATASAIFLILGAFALIHGNWRAGLAWIVQGAIVIGTFYGSYLSAICVSGHDFVTVTRGTLIGSLFSLIFLPLFPVAPYVALALRGGASSLATTVFLHVRRPLRVPWRARWREWLSVSRQGIWIHTAYYAVGPGKTAIEATIVLQVLGTTALGLWSISYTLLEIINKITQTISAVYIPRVIEEFGRTNSTAKSLELYRRPMLLALGPMVGIGIVSAVGVYLAVPMLVPKYAAAVPTMCLLMVSGPLIILEMPSTLILAGGQFVRMNIVSWSGVVCSGLLALLAAQRGLGLNGIVVASLVGQAIRVCLIYGFVALDVREERRIESVRAAS